MMIIPPITAKVIISAWKFTADTQKKHIGKGIQESAVTRKLNDRDLILLQHNVQG